MLQYFDTLTDDSGTALQGATLTVTAYPSGGATPIYQTNGTAQPIANSAALADGTGQVSFFLPDGAYIFTYAYKGTAYKVRSPVQILDPMGLVAVNDAGTANALVVTDQRLPASLYTGLKLEIKVANSNTGDTTLNLNSLGVTPVKQPGGSALVAGMLQGNGLARFEYDGTQFQLIGSQSQPFYVSVPQEQTAGVTIVNFSYIPGNVKRYGAKGDGVNDDTAAIKAAVSVTGIPVYIPAGTYKVTSTITVPNTGGYRMYGDGKTLSILKASGNYNAIITLGDLTAQSIRGCYEEFQVNALGATVNYGIYGARVEEHDFTRLLAFGFQIAGFSTGYGYVNNWVDCESSNNVGDAWYFNVDYSNGGNNAITMTGCMGLLNGGFGVRHISGYGFWMHGCVMEQNQKGAVFLVGVSNVNISCYFEGNALNGYTFTTPNITIKADIICTGSGNFTDLSNAFPCVGVKVGACNVLPRSGSTAFFFNGGAVDTEVANVYTSQPSYVPVVAQHYNPAYKGANVRIRDCSSFNTQLSEIGATASINNTYAAFVTINSPSIDLERKNYATTDMNQWTVLAGGSANTYRRSTQGTTLYRLNQTDVWEINSTAAGSSDTRGFSLNATDYPELIGKLMWYGIWVRSTDANCYAFPYCNQQSFNNNPTTLNTWTLLAVSFIWPNSGTVDCGVLKSGGNTGTPIFAAPMLCQVGVPHDEAIGLIPRYRIWYGTAAPAAGTWQVGDRIMNLTPSVGNPKSWVCTVAGTPGTWVSEGNL